jgi:hypothetical protein
MTSS